MELVLLVSQIGLFLLLFLFSNLWYLFSFLYLFLIFAFGLFSVAAGVLSIGLKSYSPFPKPRSGNVLAKKGIYKYIRHPMYSGLILMGLSFLLSRFTLLNAAIFLIFFWVNNSKANFEEKLMQKKHHEYQKYMKSTYKFILYLY